MITEQQLRETINNARTDYLISYKDFFTNLFKGLSDGEKLIALRIDAHLIKHMNNPVEQLKFAAVKQNGWTIKYIKNPSKKIQLEAIKNRSEWSIRYIKNPCIEAQLKAVQYDLETINVIDNPHKDVKLYVKLNKIS